MMSANIDQNPGPVIPGSAQNMELDTLLSQPPPRPLPKGLKGALIRKMFFPFGLFFLIGLIFFVNGLVSIIIFFPKQAGKEMKLSRGKKSNAVGIVSLSEYSGYDDVNDKIYKINYGFETADGKAIVGFSFQPASKPEPGSQVQVEYLADNPEINRIVGASLDPEGHLFLFFIIFPVIGIIILSIFGRLWIRDWNKTNRLFINGTLAPGLIKSVDKIRWNVNRQSRYKVTVGYMECETSFNVIGDAAVRWSNWLGSKTPVRVLYEPENPAEAVVVESIFKN
jgi:hypothetical protein